MSLFAKKMDAKWDPEPEAAGKPAAASSGSKNAYGIADAIQLMRSLPVEQNGELVVRVVRATLGSLNVRVEDIIEDASRKQKHVQDEINSLHGKVAELEKELEARRKEIAAHEADLKETTSVKERLQMAEKAAGAVSSLPGPSSLLGGPPTPPLGSKLPVPKGADRGEESTSSKA